MSQLWACYSRLGEINDQKVLEEERGVKYWDRYCEYSRESSEGNWLPCMSLICSNQPGKIIREARIAKCLDRLLVSEIFLEEKVKIRQFVT